MPRVCSVCTHPQRAAIDTALVAGDALRGLSALYRVSEDALARHRDSHLPTRLVKAQAAQEVAQADDLLKEVRALRAKSYSLLLAAEKAGDLRTALAGVREARACLELLAKLMGELDERPQVNVLLAPEWITVRSAMVAALGPYPDARVAVAARLVALEAGAGAGKAN